MDEEKKNIGASSEDDTSALFVTARKKQLAEQEARQKAAEEEARRVAAEAEVRRLEAEVAARKQKAEEEARRLAEEAEERRRRAEEERIADEKRVSADADDQRRLSQIPSGTPSSKPEAGKAVRSVANKVKGLGKKKLTIIGASAAGVILAVIIIIAAVSLSGGGSSMASYEDAMTGISFSCPPDMTVATGQTGWPNEIACISDENNFLLILNVTDEYVATGLTQEEFVLSAADGAAYQLFDSLYGEDVLSFQMTGDPEYDGDGDMLISENFTIETFDGNYTAFADLRNPDYGEVTVLNIAFFSPEGEDSAEDILNIISTMQLNSVG